jgi:AbrB family looped-hinge helix DNA binding protein
MKGDVRLRIIKVSEKGQIAIPADIREELKIKKGEELLLARKGDKILIEKSSKVSKRLAKEFDYLLKHAERVAEKLWRKKEDEVWDKV